MRSIRHPIMLFVAVVIAVIGLGVGVLSASTHPKVYGPPWGRFTVAFPGRVYASEGFGTVNVPGNPQSLTPFSSSLTLRLPVFGYSTSSRAWIAIAPQSGTIHPTELEVASVQAPIPQNLESGSVAISQKVSTIESLLFGGDVKEVVQEANGFSVTTMGPQCVDGQCKASKVVSNGRAIWSLLAVSGGPASNVELFLASFQPIG